MRWRKATTSQLPWGLRYEKGFNHKGTKGTKNIKDKNKNLSKNILCALVVNKELTTKNTKFTKNKEI